MQIALTKKLANAMKIDPSPVHEVIDPLFSWTANWTTVWENSETEDMLVLVNNKTRFTVAIYEVKREDLENVAEMMKTAILNTFLSMNLNPEIIGEYMRLAGKIEFTRNRSRQAAARVTKAGLECAFYVGREFNGIDSIFNDTVGAPANRRFVNYSKGADKGFYPYKVMFNTLSELTGKQIYKYCAFELLITLDLDVYKATRKIIVPANIRFTKLHRALQSVFDWENRHLYRFIIKDDYGALVAKLVPFEEDLEYDEDATLMGGLTLSEFMPEYKRIVYTYDMGDNWEHEIRLLQVIPNYDKESPYLIESSGQTPPEDVGGVKGFINFREIMSDSNHPEYEHAKEWVGYWTIELDDRYKHPRLIYIY